MDWSNEHQLPISVRKCSCIVLGNIDTSDVNYIINDQPVNTVSEVRDLGVIVDSSLNAAEGSVEGSERSEESGEQGEGCS